MTIGRIIIAVIGGIIALVGYNKQKQGAAWGQAVAVIGAIIAIIAALWGIKRQLSGDDLKDARNREYEYQRIEARVLGKEIAKQMPSAKIVIVKDTMIYKNADGTDRTDAQDTYLEGLKQGLGSSANIVKEVVPQPPKQKRPANMPANMPGMEMIQPMDMWFSSDMLKKELPDAGKYDLIIFLVPVPKDFMLKAKDLSKKKVAMLGGNNMMYGGLFKAGQAIAAATYSPNAVYDESLPADEMEAFNKRFLLLTKDNYQQVIQSNSQIFTHR